MLFCTSCTVLTDVLSDPVAISWGVQPAGGPNELGTHRHCPLVQGPPLGAEERWNSGLDGRFPKPNPCWAAESRPGTEQPEFWEKTERFLGSQGCKRWVLEENMELCFFSPLNIILCLFILVWLCAFSVFVHMLYHTTTGAVEEAGENTSATEHSRPSEQDKVQWLTDRLAHSVTDLSRTRPDQTSSSNADKGRWVKRWKTERFMLYRQKKRPAHCQYFV